jgi:hypothetical protein
LQKMMIKPKEGKQLTSFVNRIKWFIGVLIILAIILVYAFYLQPKALQVAYYNNSNKIDEIEKKAVDNFGKYSQFITDLKTNTKLDVYKDCSNQKLYKLETINKDKLAKQISEINYNDSVVISDIKSSFISFEYPKYNQLAVDFSNYTKSLITVLNQSANSTDFVYKYVSFINDQIEDCQGFVKNGFTVVGIKSYCNRTNVSVGNGNEFEEVKVLCETTRLETLNSITAKTWQIEYNKAYNALIQKQVDLSKLENLEKDAKAEFINELKLVNQQLDNDYNEKKDRKFLIYFMVPRVGLK